MKSSGLWRRIPPFVTTISLVQIIMFILQSLETSSCHSNRKNHGCHGHNGLIFTTFHFSSEKTSHWWRYLTYMLCHCSWRHLLTNVFIQMMFAWNLELIHGWMINLIIYLSAVVSGSLCCAMFKSKSILIGCSAGSMAVVTSSFIFYAQNKDILTRSWKIFIIALMVSVDFFGILSQSTRNETSSSSSPAILSSSPEVSLSSPPTSPFTHISGAIVGIVLGRMILIPK